MARGPVSIAFLGCFLIATDAAWAQGGAPAATPSATGFPAIKNTQKPGEEPPTPAEAASKITLPPGFKATLFAGEPDVAQPIAMSLDPRGRLWVAECYSYDGHSWGDAVPRDRVVILEDRDGDGVAETRGVFLDNGVRLTGLAHGFGGVYLLNKGELIHVRYGADDKPLGPATVLLDGFAGGGVGHNIVNGLAFGPDGWLYGRHGIQASSLVGAPGSAPGARISLNCCVWRYHPVRKVFEVVAHGTTNPWGMDWDDFGELYFTGNVNGHLWHALPGARYIRMYGSHFNQHLYELMGVAADHDHYDKSKNWTGSRDGKANDLGGGHSHCGGMIYLGDSFPEEYRNRMFLCNTHGRRVNSDLMVPGPTGEPVAKHGPDFMLANQPWFRGVDLRYGPDGGVYVSDWSDLGECHDHDGVHRTSGRIYKIQFSKDGQPGGGIAKSGSIDIASQSNEQLAALQNHKNDWFVRQARLELQARAAAGQDLKPLRAGLRAGIEAPANSPAKRLRSLWALHAIGGTDAAYLAGLARDPDEHVRVWAIQLLCDGLPLRDGVSAHVVGKDTDEAPALVELRKVLTGLAASDNSALVRLHVASAIHRLPLTDRWAPARALLTRKVQPPGQWPLLTWYALEPAVPADPVQALTLAQDTPNDKIARFIARRLAAEFDADNRGLAMLVDAALRSAQTVAPPIEGAFRRAGDHQARLLLTGMAEGLAGRRKLAKPAGWDALVDAVGKLDSADGKLCQKAARELSVLFGDGRAVAELRKVAEDSGAPAAARVDALAALAEQKVEGLAPMLHKLARDRAVNTAAIRALAAYDHPNTPKEILNSLGGLDAAGKAAALDTLSSRPNYALELLEAMEQGKLDKDLLKAHHIRQIGAFGDEKLGAKLTGVFGPWRPTPKEQRETIAKLKATLTPATLAQSDRKAGMVLYAQACGSCHKMRGQGGDLGPDLTGSNRDNLDYLLENIIDPSAIVPNDSRLTLVELKDGQQLAGMLAGQTDKSLTLKMVSQTQTLDKADIAKTTTTAQSMMPQGLLAPLTPAQVRDLMGYLMEK